MAFPPREFTTLSDWRSRTPAPFADRLRYAESLYKSVKRCRSVVDAKNVRFALAMEIRRVDRAADGARSGDVSGSMASSAAVYPGNATTGMSEAMQRYLRQLHVTKQKYEKRIFVLSTEASDNGGNNVERRADSKVARWSRVSSSCTHL